MQVIVAKSAGFCYGVERAVRLAEETAASNGSCKLLGSIIHNKGVVEDLRRKGAEEVNSLDEIKSGEKVLIRAHGVEKKTVQALKELGAEPVDATCPHVLRVQKLAAESAAEGRQFILIGEPQHPEVIGVASYAENPLVFSSPEEVARWLENQADPCNLPIMVAAQTTLIREVWEKSINFLKKQCTNGKYFDTICSATHRRQTEAAEIAAKVDVMVVVGDRKSANTRHLTEICAELCPRVFQIESADELPGDGWEECRVAGLTAGASTPAGVIEEVVNKMTEEIKVTEGMEESFAALLDASFKTIQSGDKVKGIVTEINTTEVVVDLGCKQPGYIKIEELSSDPDAKPEDVVKVGEEIEVFVIRVSDVDGFAQLSKKKLDAARIWDDLEAAVESKAVLEGTVTEENKGGIVVNVKGIRVFVPASQSGLPRGAELSGMLKQKVSLRITEVNRARRRVVGSIRSVTQEARNAAQAAIWESIEEGKRYTGTVKSMTSYGVFVDIGGVDGMVHISELSWSRIKNPAEIVAVGDTLEVYVISVDKDKRKISLGVKDHGSNPWDVFTSKYQVGDSAEVRVVKLMAFGAFAEVVPGVDGLIHISQVADHRVEKVGDVLSEGQIVTAKITAVDEENKKISLSIRALLAGEEAAAADEE
ncbi:MAG: bifunctional 4-hydroxy-3-methylbut-2-enyl diphosphate reductase/30S ribosomal protein S1 [Oscillospiraceae bacterium]|nr:bifunctional 4-hydroxy-3-methylbut-2-enyl diphosphate reductase/30S ribosomal protein S1 [Oscillospiraceae bacterium]